MSPPQPPLAFTTTYSAIVNSLITDVHLTAAFDAAKDRKRAFAKLKGLWDTGATNSVITQKAVDDCKLQPIGMTKVNTVSGQTACPVFLVAMGLPNKVLFNQVRVTLGELWGDIEVLIGMDIIQRGDFAITNRDNKTVFSFRVPSSDLIDFVQEPKVGRNEPCPCGSGRKYKKCHGVST